MKCRHCHENLQTTFLDLGFQPPSNAYIKSDDLKKAEIYFPLKILVCEHCWLVQTEDYASSDSYFTDDYAYFSSVSSTWLAHAKEYSDMITNRLGLNEDSFVIEIASNDGYLLKNFVASNIPCLGVEPTESTALVAIEAGIPVMQEFFGKQLALKEFANRKADLILGNNVYAHVPDINDFTSGLKHTLRDGGTITLEFPHLLSLIESNQFDTVYHEHFSYLSLLSVERIFKKQGLRVFDVERLTTHGGSLRIYACHEKDSRENTDELKSLLSSEIAAKLNSIETYQSFQAKAETVKNNILRFLLDQKREGKIVAAYGAAAKGNTLLNFAGVQKDLVEFVCDAAPSKQKKYMPGSHIPILDPSHLQKRAVDFVLILPWNLADEIAEQLSYLRKGGTKFVIAVPELRIF
jgi:SAM-dependent methyltransferase